MDFVICSDPGVLKANEVHEKAWYDARARLSDAEKQELLTDQRRWLKEFPPRCGVPAQGRRPPTISREQQLCVERKLEERTTFLEEYRGHSTEARSAPGIATRPPDHPLPAADRIGPSFDCSSPQQLLAQVICADPELSVTDLRFTQVYFALLKQMDEAGKRDLKQEDIRFIEAVKQHCGIPLAGSAPAQSDSLRKCVKEAYESQRSVWLLRVGPPLSEEANRPIEQHIALQRLLQQLGYLSADAVIDGVYGPGTREAISHWQRSEYRDVTGILGDDDAQALTKEASKAGPSSATTEELRPPKQGLGSIDSAQKPPERMDTTDRANSTSAPQAQPERPSRPTLTDNPPASSMTNVSDCRIVAPAPVPYINDTPYQDVTAKWSGSCVAGLADGIGAATWYSRGIQFLVEEFTSKNGAVMKGGRPAASDTVNVSVVDWKITICKKLGRIPNSYPIPAAFPDNARTIEGQVPVDFDLAKTVVTDKLLAIAERVVWRECPVTGFTGKPDPSNISVYLVQNGKQIVVARSYGDGFAAGGHRELENSLLKARWEAALRTWESERDRRQKVEAQAREEAVREQTRQRVNLSHQRFDNFVQKNGIEAWPSSDQLRANPFIYEGKIVGLLTSFDQMIGRDRGIFAGGVLVSSLPTDAFQAKIQVLLAAQVKGNELIERPLGGKIPLPHLKFVDFYKCEQNNCDDALLWQHPH